VPSYTLKWYFPEIAIVADMGKLKGRIHRDVLNEIAAAVKRAPTLSPAEQIRLVESLQREDD
jgi:hypothetical protein